VILDKIAASTRLLIEQKKRLVSLTDIKKQAEGLDKNNAFAFEKAINKQDISFICEVKKASPSKGIIAENFNCLEIAKEYEQAGADALSVLTEPNFFLGSDEYLHEIQKEVSIPVLRKDFTIDEYQIYEAKALGASAVLLICSLLNTDILREYILICSELGLSALVEAHDETEVESALKAGARIVGVNNRNLKDFSVDINNSLMLRKYVPENILFVAESGIKTAKDVQMLRQANVNAVLIGETLMRSGNKQKALDELRGIAVD